VHLPEGTEMVMPGDNTEMRVEMIQPIAMEEGLKFAIREGGRTVGAGRSPRSSSESHPPAGCSAPAGGRHHPSLPRACRVVAGRWPLSGRVRATPELS
jgi:hypothetical protein